MKHPLLFHHQLLDWFDRHRREMPWRDDPSPYKVWVSEIILQQTRVDQGTPYFLRFVERFPSVQGLAEASQDEVLRLWQGLGYYSRARNLHQAAKTIAARGCYPASAAEWKKLPGVGDYTAGAIASIAFGEPVAAVDGNVLRVLTRFFGLSDNIASQTTHRKIRTMAETVMQAHRPGDFNQALMELGALVCSPRQPDCANCPLLNGCSAAQTNTTHLLPVKTKGQKSTRRYLHYYYIANESFVWVRKRTGKDIWNSLYELPLIETTHTRPPGKQLRNQHFGIPKNMPFRLVYEITHPLSHQTLYCRFYRSVSTLALSELPGYQPISSASLRHFAFPVPIVRFFETMGL